MHGVRLLLSRWRADAGLLTVVLVVIALTAGLVGAVPRLLDRLALASLDGAVDSVTVDRSGLAASTIRPFGAARADVVAGAFDRLAAELDEGLAPELQASLGAPDPLLDTIRYDLARLPGEPPDGLQRKLTVRVQPGAEERATLRTGDLPDGEVATIDLEVPDADGVPVPTTFAVHQFAATAATDASLDL